MLHVSNDFCGIRGLLEGDAGAQQWRNKKRHKLPKDVAQGNESREAQGMKPALVFSILINAPLERLKICQKISVGENHASRLGGRSGSVENLRDCAASASLTGITFEIRCRLWRRRNLFETVDDQGRNCA